MTDEERELAQELMGHLTVALTWIKNPNPPHVTTLMEDCLDRAEELFGQ